MVENQIPLSDGGTLIAVTQAQLTPREQKLLVALLTKQMGMRLPGAGKVVEVPLVHYTANQLSDMLNAMEQLLNGR